MIHSALSFFQKLSRNRLSTLDEIILPLSSFLALVHYAYNVTETQLSASSLMTHPDSLHSLTLLTAFPGSELYPLSSSLTSHATTLKTLKKLFNASTFERVYLCLRSGLDYMYLMVSG